MKYSAKFNKRLQIASLDSKSSWHRLKVHTLMQNVKQKQPSINAFLGARYSRSSDSIVDIAKEIMDSKVDAAKKLEIIFQGYGHKSVGDMAELFVCIEHAPMIQVQKLFYMNPVHSGQERSTRFQNFKEPNFVKLPRGTAKHIVKEYETIIHTWMKHYRDLLEPTKEAFIEHFKPDQANKGHMSALQARTFDTARGFLPIGLETSLALVMSARSWADLIGQFRASNQAIDRDLAEMLFTLLTGNKELEKLGYTPEADGLIRHTEANQSRNNSTQALMRKLKDELKTLKNLKINKEMGRNSKISMKSDAIESFLSHYLLLQNPLANVGKIKLSKGKLEKVGKELFKQHDHHKQIGSVGQTGAILIQGFGDYGGVLKDINRHRSLERFFPLLMDHINLEAELDRPETQCYFVYDYLNIPAFKDLRKEYVKRFDETYSRVKKWIKNAKNELPEELVREYGRYMLPHAHAARYKLYGSIDDWQYLIHLRTRNGGHIAYRNLSYQWLEKLAEKSALFKPMLKKIPKVAPASREQFFDRS